MSLSSNTPPVRSAHPLRNWKSGGFTLIELMIVVAIITILAVIALPSYQDSIRKSRRTLAKTALQDLAAREERFFSLNNQYATLVQLGITTALVDGNGNTAYNLNVLARPAGVPATQPFFAFEATPAGDQANDRCGAFSIDSFGRQTAALAQGCW